jgi:hypothetical protein
MHMGKPGAADSPNVGLLIALVSVDELRSCIGKGPKSIQLRYVRGMHHMRQPHIRHLRSPLSANTQYCQKQSSQAIPFLCRYARPLAASSATCFPLEGIATPVSFYHTNYTLRQ